MHSNCSIFVNIHNFAPIDVGVFLVKMCKLHTFLHFGRTDVVAFIASIMLGSLSREFTL